MQTMQPPAHLRAIPGTNSNSNSYVQHLPNTKRISPLQPQFNFQYGHQQLPRRVVAAHFANRLPLPSPSPPPVPLVTSMHANVQEGASTSLSTSTSISKDARSRRHGIVAPFQLELDKRAPVEPKPKAQEEEPSVMSNSGVKLQRRAHVKRASPRANQTTFEDIKPIKPPSPSPLPLTIPTTPPLRVSKSNSRKRRSLSTLSLSPLETTSNAFKAPSRSVSKKLARSASRRSTGGISPGGKSFSPFTPSVYTPSIYSFYTAGGDETDETDETDNASNGSITPIDERRNMDMDTDRDSTYTITSDYENPWKTMVSTPKPEQLDQVAPRWLPRRAPTLEVSALLKKRRKAARAQTVESIADEEI